MKRILIVLLIMISSRAFGVEIDSIKILAENGDAEAQSLMGACYYKGKYVPKNHEESMKWYQKAAEQGCIRAQFMLGGAYFIGQGVEKSFAKSVKWLRKASEKGQPEAQLLFGAAYKFGKGVSQNYAEAYFWFNIGASQDEKFAGYRDEMIGKLTLAKLEEVQERCARWLENFDKSRH